MPRFHPQLLASQNVRVRRSHKDIPAHLSRFRGKQPRSVEESCLHTTEPAWRGVQTKLQPETLGLLLLPPLSYSLAPFHQRSPRAGKLGPWAKSCQLQALVNKVLLESAQLTCLRFVAALPQHKQSQLSETKTSALQASSVYYRAFFTEALLLSLSVLPHL